MKTTIAILLCCAAAHAQVIHIPLGAQATNTPLWISTPGAVPSGAQAWQFAESNFSYLASHVATAEASLGALPDTSTNAIVSSPKVLSVFTNGFTWSASATNYLPWAVTNPAGVTFTMPQGAADLNFSKDGTNWSALDANGIAAANLIVTGVVHYAFFPPSMPGVGTVLNPVVTNFSIFIQSRPDKCGVTNSLYGQSTRTGAPSDPDDIVPKQYVDTLVAGAIASAQGPSQLNGQPMNFSQIWAVTTSSTTNAEGWHLTFMGLDTLTVIQPPAVLCGPVKISLVTTNVQVSIPTNGLATVPTLQVTHSLAPANWLWVTQATNWISTTNYVFQFPLPFKDMAFIRAAVPSSQPAIVTIAGVLQLPSFTVTNATDAVPGGQAGIIRSDGSYLYVSGTNSWKRAALSTW